MLAGVALVGTAGCHMILPDISHQPIVHNPFPQLSRVAVAPFFNLSDEPTVDGRKFALAYFGELQAVAGFEVVPLGVVEEAILEHRVDLSSADEARRLARILGVDAVVIGSVTDYEPYYPPRCGMRVEWYSANAGYHEIPPGYGLPWGTPHEEFIPAPLVFEAEMALAKAQLATQVPPCDMNIAPLPVDAPSEPPPPQSEPPQDQQPDNLEDTNVDPGESSEPATDAGTTDGRESDGEIAAQFEEELPPADSSEMHSLPPPAPDSIAGAATIDAIGAHGAYGALPPDWPDERGFIPPPPRPVRPECLPHQGPVMTHTRIYHATDSQFTEALASYYHFRDDARFGGWQNYLQRSDDFVRFCCHLHISEMLSARGGAGETRVVWRWSDCR
jgi:hypothetical protein